MSRRERFALVEGGRLYGMTRWERFIVNLSWELHHPRETWRMFRAGWGAAPWR